MLNHISEPEMSFVADYNFNTVSGNISVIKGAGFSG
jgi:hypothetical protein